MSLSVGCVVFCLCRMTHWSVFLSIYVRIWEFSGRKCVITVIVWVVDLHFLMHFLRNGINYKQLPLTKIKTRLVLVFAKQAVLHLKFLFNYQVIHNGWSHY